MVASKNNALQIDYTTPCVTQVTHDNKRCVPTNESLNHLNIINICFIVTQAHMEHINIRIHVKTPFVLPRGICSTDWLLFLRPLSLCNTGNHVTFTLFHWFPAVLSGTQNSRTRVTPSVTSEKRGPSEHN